MNSLFAEGESGFWRKSSAANIFIRNSCATGNSIRKGVLVMAKTVHHGGKVGAAGKALASKSTSKSQKSRAGKTLADHKNKCH